MSQPLEAQTVDNSHNKLIRYMNNSLSAVGLPIIRKPGPHNSDSLVGTLQLEVMSK